MKSELVRSVFEDEFERNKRLVSRYEKEIERLPKGAVFKRKIGNQEYYYLNYRNGKKVVSKFLGNVVDYNIEELKENLNKRKDLSKVIKKLKLEQKEILKELR